MRPPNYRGASSIHEGPEAIPASARRRLIRRITPPPRCPPSPAAAQLSGGRRIWGTVTVLSDYMVTIREADGSLHTVNRTTAAKLELKDPLQAHADRMKIMSDRQMHDL